MTRSLLVLLVGTLCTLARAVDAPKAPDPRPELTIVVVESLDANTSRINAFDRIARMFTETFEQRQWPVKIETERFAANQPLHPIELKVFFQRIAEEIQGELTFRGWMTLEANGAKHDFGVIRARYSYRAAEDMNERLDRVTQAAAVMAADKIERILFPATPPPR